MQVVTRGRYMAPGTPFTDVDKPLHLHTTPGACSSEVNDSFPSHIEPMSYRSHTTIYIKI